MRYLVVLLLLSGCVTVTHGEDYENVFKSHADEVRACYQQRLKKKPALEGQLILELVVENAGEVQTAHFGDASTITDEPLRQCLHDKAVKWTFPAPRDEQTIMMAYPYTFLSSQGGVVKLGQEPKKN